MGSANGQILTSPLRLLCPLRPKGTRSGHSFAALRGRTLYDHLRAAALRRLRSTWWGPLIADRDQDSDRAASPSCHGTTE